MCAFDTLCLGISLCLAICGWTSLFLNMNRCGSPNIKELAPFIKKMLFILLASIF